MKKYFTVIISISLLFLSCKSEKLENPRLILMQKIDVHIAEYSKNNYINESVLGLYKTMDIDCKNANKLLKKAYQDDQDIRHLGNGDIYKVDSLNLVKVISVLKKCKSNLIIPKTYGRYANPYESIFSILNHSGDTDLMAYCYKDIRQFALENKINYSGYAVYSDRLLTYMNKKQLFGTQYNIETNLHPIENPLEVNKRRKLFNLSPLEK